MTDDFLHKPSSNLIPPFWNLLPPEDSSDNFDNFPQSEILTGLQAKDPQTP